MKTPYAFVKFGILIGFWAICSTSCNIENDDCTLVRASIDKGLASPGFVVSYLDDVDTFFLSNVYCVKDQNERWTGDDDQIWRFDPSHTYSFGKESGLTMGLRFGHSDGQKGYNFQKVYALMATSQKMGTQLGLNIPMSDLIESSKKYRALCLEFGDTNFTRMMVESSTNIYSSGRTALLESIKAIRVFADRPYRDRAAGEDLSDFFALTYCNAFGAVAACPSFTPVSTSWYRVYAPDRTLHADPVLCTFGVEDLKTTPATYHLRRDYPAGYQFYDAEYYAQTLTTSLSQMDFAAVPHLSALLALRPVVFPTKTETYRFFVEVQFSSGKVLYTRFPADLTLVEN